MDPREMSDEELVAEACGAAGGCSVSAPCAAHELHRRLREARREALEGAAREIAQLDPHGMLDHLANAIRDLIPKEPQ